MRVLAERNLRLYPRMAVASSVLPWLPIHYLLLVDRFGLDTAMLLGALYYVSVVAAEVPTGRWSDRRGRVSAMRLCAGAWLGSHLLVAAMSTSLPLVALAEVLLAIGFAAISGTDVTIHHEALEALGRDDELEEREGAVRRRAFALNAVSVAVGGLAGALDLRLPYLLAAAAAAYTLWVSSQLVELGPTGGAAGGADPPLLRGSVGRLREPLLFAITFAVVVNVVLQHIVSELGQPYLADVLGTPSAAVWSGVLLAGSAALGALAAGWADPLRRGMGLLPALLLVAAVPAPAIVAMAVIRHPLVLPLLALRSVPFAAAAVLVSGAVMRAVPAPERATTLSLMSLAGRLSYAAALLLLSSAATLQATLRWSAILAVALLVSQWGWSRRASPALTSGVR